MAPNSKVDETPPDVPLFLRKTYHMIDSCDPSIACWSDDGETFIVKDPSKFETQIIPQFFKHSKFTSFVRQLNFYSFRKIKYMDTLRLDPKLEAETANFWRFRHDKFQRGKPRLLSEIKRMTAATPKKGPAPASASKEEAPVAMKSELDSLKKRIEEMNKNMSQLTTMVQKVTLSSSTDKDADDSTKPAATMPDSDPDSQVGSKRKKLDLAVPDGVESGFVAPGLSQPQPESILPPGIVGSKEEATLFVQPDEMLSSAMDFEEVLPMDLSGDEPSQLQPLGTIATIAAPASNSDGVDKFYTFDSDVDDDAALIDICRDDSSEGGVLVEDTTATGLLPDPSMGLPPAAEETSRRRKNRADPELMDRLSEALAVLPKEMQEQIVERLIAAITTTDLFTAPIPSDIVQDCDLTACTEGGNEESTEQDSTSSPEVGMPLAAATLAALLSHYSEQVKKHTSSSGNSADKDKAARSGVKSIPVIPVHA